MNIVTNELTGHTRDLLTTEILFFIASARATNSDLIKIKIKSDDTNPITEQKISEINGILKSVKRRKLIQLFVTSEQFESQSTEIAYLLNKYPDLPQELGDDYYIILKL